jgi:putative Mn2+ efflux pump MntP
MARNLFYPTTATWLAFTLLSILGINFFVDAADNEFTNNNPFTGLGLLIGLPLYYTQ